MSGSTPASTPLRRRSQARSLALAALCVYDAVGEAFTPDLPRFLRDEDVLRDLGVESPPAPELLTFARALCAGTWSLRPRYDELLAQKVSHWSVNRMTPVDRNILRLGLHELLELRDAAPQIILNESIDLARRFGDTDSPSFVNGVLDAIRRECAAGPDHPVEPPPPGSMGGC